MHTEHKREEPLVDMGYEIRDINYPALGKTAFFFVIFSLFCFGSVGVWFWLTQPKTGSFLDPRKPLPAISLQSNIEVRTDISTLRKHETEVLSSQGVNPDGSQRIPIEQAMTIIASRGLAAKRTEVKATSPGNTIKQNALAPGEQPPISGDVGGSTP